MNRKQLIRQRMKERNISVRDVARETGMSSTSVYRFIRGSRTSWILKRWCWDRLGLDADTLPVSHAVSRTKEVQ